MFIRASPKEGDNIETTRSRDTCEGDSGFYNGTTDLPFRYKI